jgi:glycosyltransferase involved in cell wall biosynthesis
MVLTSKPKVSVIMPAFNGGRYIREAMNSVIAQTYRAFELIVVDDGSTDKTRDIVSDFIKENRELPIRYLYQANRGAASARNAGIADVRGEYIAFLDCDDVWFPHKLEVQVPALETDKSAGLVFGDIVSFGEGRVDTAPASKIFDLSKIDKGISRLFAGNYISTLTVMVKKACLEKAGVFDESVTIVEDYDLWLRIAKYCKIVYVDSLVAKYRVHPGNLSRITKDNEEKLLLDMIKIRKRALEQSPEILRELSPGTLNRCYYKLYLNLATLRLKRGDRAGARENIMRYVGFYRYNPVAYLAFMLTFVPLRINELLWNFKERLSEK